MIFSLREEDKILISTRLYVSTALWNEYCVPCESREGKIHIYIYSWK